LPIRDGALPKKHEEAGPCDEPEENRCDGDQHGVEGAGVSAGEWPQFVGDEVGPGQDPAADDPPGGGVGVEIAGEDV